MSLPSLVSVELRFVDKAADFRSFSQLLAGQAELYQENALSQRDINEIYKSATYVFDIYNDTYQFRLCDLSYGAQYPVKVMMDEGVEEEARGVLRNLFEYDDSSGTYAVTSDDELKKCFAIMIQSEKTGSILRRLYRG